MAAIEEVLTIAACSDSRRCGSAARGDARHAEHVDVEDPAPLVVVVVRDRARRADAGVVDERCRARRAARPPPPTARGPRRRRSRRRAGRSAAARRRRCRGRARRPARRAPAAAARWPRRCPRRRRSRAPAARTGRSSPRRLRAGPDRAEPGYAVHPPPSRGARPRRPGTRARRATRRCISEL